MPTKKAKRRIVKKAKTQKVRRKTVKTVKQNTRFPGRSRYVGPKEGIFGFVHHAVLYEFSNDIRNRVWAIRDNKPKDEQAIRLHHLVYLGPKRPYNNEDALKLIKRYIPKPKWDGDSLLKADGCRMTG